MGVIQGVWERQFTAVGGHLMVQSPNPGVSSFSDFVLRATEA